MIRKYHNHIMQTNPRHCEEELQDQHLQDDCKTRMDTKQRLKTKTNTELPQQ